MVNKRIKDWDSAAPENLTATARFLIDEIETLSATLAQLKTYILSDQTLDASLVRGATAGRDIAMATHKITGLGDPSAAQDAVTLNYIAPLYGTAAPATTPVFKGQIFVDTTNKRLYVAHGTSSAADWVCTKTELVNTQTGTTYTFLPADNGKLVTLNNGSAITATIDTNANQPLPVGTQIDILQLGAGKVTVAAAGDVTLYSKGSNKALAAQYVGGTLLKIDTDVWVLMGSLIA